MKLRLKEVRTQTGLTQTQFAELINSNQQSVTDWETGKKDPRLETLILAADVLDVSLDYLVYRSDVPYRVNSCVDKNGTTICFTTKEPPSEWAGGQEDGDGGVAVTVDAEALPTSRKELEQFVESLVRKALSSRE